MISYEERFGKNLQKMRVGLGLSQRRLGEIIGFTDKAISKWECGGGIPDIPVLYRMAEVFHVRLDDFFAEDTRYYLGIDGGGTKSTLALADADLNILRQERIDACNPIDIGMEETTARLRDGITRICRDLPTNKIVLFAGIAGGTSADYKASLAAFFREFGFLAYENDSDNRNIIAAGLGKGNGVSVIMGTGICAFSQKDGVLRRCAGWGYLFDDGGSAYNIGRDAIAAHFAATDGTGATTAISELICAAHPDPQLLLGELYRGGKKEIAGYAHIVYDAARTGDAVAVSILQRNMRCAAHVIETAAASFADARIPVVLTGGLTTELDTLIYLKNALRDPARYDIQLLSFSPVHGALLLARELADAYDQAEGNKR